MENKLVLIENTEKDYKKLQIFFEQEKESFHINLDKVVNLNDYINKILEKAIIYAYLNEKEEIIGLIVFYANDNENHVSHIALLCVNKDYRGRHLATNLVEKAIEISKKHNMHCITLYTHVTNIIPQKLYEKVGFKRLESDREDNVFYRKELI